MKITPLQQWVSIKLEGEYENSPKSGLYVPPSSLKKIPKGKIIAKGDYCSNNFDVGETVMFSKSGTKYLPKEDITLVPEYKIMLKDK